MKAFLFIIIFLSRLSGISRMNINLHPLTFLNKNSKLTRADLAWFILAAMFCLPSHAETNDHQAAILEAALELNRSITWGMATNGVKAGIYHSKISDEPQTKGGFWDNAVFSQISNPFAGYPLVVWSSGQFTWNIPGKWWVEGSTNKNSIANGWQQVFTIDANGTMTVTKFNHTATRTTNQTHGTVN